MLVTISDRRLATDDGNGEIAWYDADVVTANDYYPFGMGMPGRKYSADGAYRYGFNGKERDNEVKGDGAQYDYGFRIYDPRLGRFLSVDPLFKSYPWYTPYQFAGNKPITSVDLDGLEEAEGVEVTLGAGYNSKLAILGANLAKANPNYLAVMQQQAWNKLLVKIDAIIPKYFDYKKNLNGILFYKVLQEIESEILLSDEATEFNSLLNYNLDEYTSINPLLIQAANDLANDHYRASMNSKEFYEKYIKQINDAKDPNSKAALIEDRSEKSWILIKAFQEATIGAAESFLDMTGTAKSGTSRGAYSNFAGFKSSDELSGEVAKNFNRFVKSLPRTRRITLRYKRLMTDLNYLLGSLLETFQAPTRYIKRELMQAEIQQA
ncbi:MAG: RHS repeat domain-containing protein [Chitinophagaceae bacterium]